MRTKATDYAFVFDSIHRVIKVNKAKVNVVFSEAIGWEITNSRMYGADMEVEYEGKRDGVEDIIPDYAGDLDALKFAIEDARLIIGPEYAFFEERHTPSGWAIYRKWEQVAVDYMDRLGSKSAVCISQDINVAIMLGYMIVKGIPVDLQVMK